MICDSYKTEKLYDTSPYAAEFTAKVRSVEETKNGCAVILDKTLFFPEEGGQSCDRGTLNGVKVAHVSIANGVITHFCETLPAEIGETVAGKIDFAPRFRNMQNHTAEHIVSGLVHTLYSYNNVGFHLGHDEVTMDYDGTFLPEDLETIEKRANEVVYQNLAVTAVYYTKEEAAALFYRSKIEIDGAIRIVTIPDVDVCACCAPHVAHTGEIGAIKLLSAEHYKGGTRVHMLAGSDARDDYAAKHAAVAKISAALSVKPDDAANAVERLMDENAALGARLTLLQKALCRAYAEGVPTGTALYFRVFSPDEMNANGLRVLADRLLSRCRLCALFLQSDKEDSVFQFLLASSELNVSDIYKDFSACLNAKGGGRAPFVSGRVEADVKTISGYFTGIKL